MADTPMVVNDGFGFGGGMGIFAFFILALLFGGNGWGNNGNGNSNAIQNDINRGFDQQNTMAQTRDILGAVTSGTAQTIAASTANATNAINAIKDGNAGIIREFGNVETALTALAGKQQECCCNQLRASDGILYNNAINTAAINANTTAQTQKILDAITGNRMADMQNQIDQLRLNSAMSGVVRYPQAITYGAGPSPFCGCGAWNYAL
jgi:hypothetical protein